MSNKYSINSMTWTSMARLPWLIQTRFSVPRKSSRKQIFNDILGKFSFIMKMYVVCIHWNRLIAANLMSTLDIPLLYRRSKKNIENIPKSSPFAPWPCIMINSMARLTHVWNTSSWSQRCSSHWGSTAYCMSLKGARLALPVLSLSLYDPV